MGEETESVPSLFELAAMAVPNKVVKRIPEGLLSTCIEVWKFRKPCAFISIQWLYGNNCDVLSVVPNKGEERVSCCTLDAFRWRVSEDGKRFYICSLFYGSGSCSHHEKTIYTGCCVYEETGVTYFNGYLEDDWRWKPLPKLIQQLRKLDER